MLRKSSKPFVASVALAALLTISSFEFAWAGLLSYQCVITTEINLQDDGKLRPFQRPIVLNKRFSIDRRNGALVGPEGAPWTFMDSTASLLATGNNANSFVATYTASSAGSGVHFTAIRVVEFNPNRLKPFVAISGSTVHSGLCE
jgi:hypothetical protein